MSSYEGDQKVIKKLRECVCDLEKIAFVGEESVECGFETLKRRAGTGITTASCQVGFTGCKHPSCST